MCLDQLAPTVRPSGWTRISHKKWTDSRGLLMRALDMGSGSGVSALLAARAGAEVIAVDVNPAAVDCGRENATRNGLADRIKFARGDLFEGVDGDFDLITFDPPFRWFEPRDLVERSHADAGYQSLRGFI